MYYCYSNPCYERTRIRIFKIALYFNIENVHAPSGHLSCRDGFLTEPFGKVDLDLFLKNI